MSKQSITGASTVDQENENGQELDELIWDLGRAYYAYVGLLERVLVEQRLNDTLQPGMGLVLFALFERDGRTIKELAERSQLACSTLTGLLTRMEKNGLITRTRDFHDGRLVRVTLTDAARKLEKRCRSMAKRMTDVSHRGVGSKHIKACQSYLRGMTAAFREEEALLASEQSNNP